MPTLESSRLSVLHDETTTGGSYILQTYNILWREFYGAVGHLCTNVTTPFAREHHLCICFRQLCGASLANYRCTRMASCIQTDITGDVASARDAII